MFRYSGFGEGFGCSNRVRKHEKLSSSLLFALLLNSPAQARLRGSKAVFVDRKPEAGYDFYNGIHPIHGRRERTHFALFREKP